MNKQAPLQKYHEMVRDIGKAMCEYGIEEITVGEATIRQAALPVAKEDG